MENEDLNITMFNGIKYNGANALDVLKFCDGAFVDRELGKLYLSTIDGQAYLEINDILFKAKLNPASSFEHYYIWREEKDKVFGMEKWQLIQ